MDDSISDDEPAPGYKQRTDDWTEAVLESVRPNGAESLLQIWRVAKQMADELRVAVVRNGMALDVESIVPYASHGIPVVRVSLEPCEVRRFMELAKCAGFQTLEIFSGPSGHDDSRHAA